MDINEALKHIAVFAPQLDDSQMEQIRAILYELQTSDLNELIDILKTALVLIAETRKSTERLLGKINARSI